MAKLTLQNAEDAVRLASERLTADVAVYNTVRKTNAGVTVSVKGVIAAGNANTLPVPSERVVLPNAERVLCDVSNAVAGALAVLTNADSTETARGAAVKVLHSITQIGKLRAECRVAPALNSAANKASGNIMVARGAATR